MTAGGGGNLLGFFLRTGSREDRSKTSLVRKKVEILLERARFDFYIGMWNCGGLLELL